MNNKFTTPCFIHKNTPELRKKLKEFGYKVLPNFADFPCLSARNGLAIPTDSFNRNGGFDCGTNEQLFIALASLREESDYMQWFCSDEPDFDDRCFFLCQCYTLNEHIQGDKDFDVSTYHKATVDELIEYFK